jgi:hypothetical protein
MARMARDDGKLGEFVRVSWDFIMMSWDFRVIFWDFIVISWEFIGISWIIGSGRRFNEICFMGFTLWFSQTSPKNGGLNGKITQPNSGCSIATVDNPGTYRRLKIQLRDTLEDIVNKELGQYVWSSKH